MSTATRTSRKAEHPGDCAGCRATIQASDLIFYVTGNPGAIGLECCGDRDDADLIPAGYELPGDSLSVDDEDPSTVIARVMPRGRHAADACPRCRQVPANNGSCGCDY